MNKINFNINKISDITDIFERYLSFLPYSTRKRNIAYKIQHLEFMIGIRNNYKMYGSIASIFNQQGIVLIHSIIESVMFCVLIKEGVIGENSGMGFDTLSNRIRQKNIISRETVRKLNTLNTKRNILHPRRQNDLDINSFLVTDVNTAIDTFKSFFKDLDNYYLIP